MVEAMALRVRAPGQRTRARPSVVPLEGVKAGADGNKVLAQMRNYGVARPLRPRRHTEKGAVR